MDWASLAAQAPLAAVFAVAVWFMYRQLSATMNITLDRERARADRLEAQINDIQTKIQDIFLPAANKSVESQSQVVAVLREFLAQQQQRQIEEKVRAEAEAKYRGGPL